MLGHPPATLPRQGWPLLQNASPRSKITEKKRAEKRKFSTK